MLFGGILGTSLICILLLLLSITCYVYTIEKSLSISSMPYNERIFVTMNDESQSSSNPRIEEGFGEDECNATPDAENVDGEPKEKKSLTRSALKQSLLYIVAFIFTYSPFFAHFLNPAMVDSKVGKSILLWSNSTILPIYGIFLIHQRCEYYLKCSKLVLGSGGEVPPAHELKPSHLPRMSMEDGESPPHDSDLILSMSEAVSYEDLKSSMIAVSKSDRWSNRA